MDTQNKNIDVYGLVTDLSKQILKTESSVHEHSYLPQRRNSKTIKKLRATAFAILLKKTKNVQCITDNTHKNDCDPIAEIYKHAFALKLAANGNAKAIRLESLIEELSNEDLQKGSSVYAVLQFLVDLKSFHTKVDSELNVFHFGEANPALPDVQQITDNIPSFQVYPLECFILSEKLDAMLHVKRHYIEHEVNAESITKLCFMNPLKSAATVDIKSIRCDSTLSRSLRCTSTYTSSLHIPDIDRTCYLPSEIKNGDQFQECFSLTRDSFTTNVIVSFPQSELIETDRESVSDAWKSSNHSLCNETENAAYLDYMWSEADLEDVSPTLRTWETLGVAETTKQALFTTEVINAVFHLARIRQTNTLSLLPTNDIDSVSLLEEVTMDQFLKDVKLLLFGIESNSFKYSKMTGFVIKKNIAICTISPEWLAATCEEVVQWGNCFKSLTSLVELNSQTGKLEQDGFIFKAMCTNIQEFLLYYRATVLRIFAHLNTSNSLLKVLKNVQHVGNLITEVARLCQCNEQMNSTLGEGSGILTHIYKEVTEVTNPKVALVFYSILKSCCEVYFRFLQKWLFEGLCDDTYGEFMIKARPQYLCNRGHKFWTKSFAVCQQSVPGFLSGLSQSILQCGKAVRLLKICDPQNPLCSVFTAFQPELKVCLSAASLREQLSKCQEYKNKAETALGPIVSLSSAIQDQKSKEKDRENVAIHALQDTLTRIKREQEEIAKKVAQDKRELLQALKDQATESALHKVKEREAELLADRLRLEQLNQEQLEAQDLQLNEELYLRNCYDELTSNIEHRRIRADWRIRRIACHEKRFSLLSEMDTNLFPIVDSPDLSLTQISKTEKSQENSTRATVNSKEVKNLLEKPHNICVDNLQLGKPADENSNIAEHEPVQVPKVADSTDFVSNPNIHKTNIENVTHSARPDDNKNNVKCLPSPRKIQNTHSKNVLKPLPPESTINKRHNERSDLQDYLRNEAMNEKLLSSMVRHSAESSERNREITTVLTDDTNNKPITRPTYLNFKKLDNTTQAELNKLKVLQQEYGMTPNNNVLNIVLSNKANNTDLINSNSNVFNSDHIACDLTRNITIEERNTAELPRNKEILRETINLQQDKNKELPSVRSIDTLKDVQLGDITNTKRVINEDASRTQQISSLSSMNPESNIGTPMSCTTDNFAPSAGTPMSQLQTYEYTPSDITGGIMTSSDPTKSYMEGSAEFTPNKHTLLNAIDFGSNLNTPTATTSLTIADVELIDNTSLQMYLQKSVTIPLQIQSRLVNNAIIKYLLNEHNMLLHLQSLRSYFFLLNGEFAKSLTDALYTQLYEICVPIELFNSATLTNLLERALVNSFCNSYVNSELLSLSAVNIPQQLHISDPDALDCLCLNYKITWPLNIILDDMVMLQYSKVFKFLIITGRVSWVLQEDFNIMKVERNVAMSEQYHKLQLYRHAMTQFMNALHNYLTCSVLHASWTEFEKDLKMSVTVDQVYFSHVNYIKRILSRCMLNVRGEKMRTCLNNVFKVILQFHNRLRSQSWTAGPRGYTHPNFKRLEQMYKAFCELRTYLAHVAFKLATSGYQPHLMHFLNALNINQLYDLTVKSS